MDNLKQFEVLDTKYGVWVPVEARDISEVCEAYAEAARDIGVPIGELTVREARVKPVQPKWWTL